jgi:DNA helicase-2/ATP-dependent DNA helicase PcrA
MLQKIEISEKDIARAEGILLPPGCIFDEERRDFIRNFNTIDLQAVPGSGKTTALLAKLLILETKLPLIDGGGILVLSHTNGAVDEIKAKIERYCPKLFSYPHFIGTIQSFTDRFLTVPHYGFKYQKRPIRIDNEIYDERVSRYNRMFFKNYAPQDQNNAKRLLRTGELFKNLRFSYNSENKLVLTKGYNGLPVSFNKPKANTLPKNYIDWNASEQAQVKSWLLDFKRIFFKQGFLCFDDAYLLAFEYLAKTPKVLDILRSRFPIVFVDEMQDMDKHQYDLLEKIFFTSETQQTTYQRIGDRNQAIYAGKVKVENYWEDRQNVLKLSNSLRLSAPIAALVDRFALYRVPGFQVVGLHNASHKPYIYRYTSANIQQVIPVFFKEILTLQGNGCFPENPKDPIKVVAWNSSWKEGDSKKDNCFRLTDYSPRFSRDQKKVRIDYVSLKQYLYSVKIDETHLGVVRNILLNALLKVVRLENITDTQERYYTKATLLSHIRHAEANEFSGGYDLFTSHLYEWSWGLVNNQIDEVWTKMREYIPTFLAFFRAVPKNCLEFLNFDSDKSEIYSESVDSKSNILKCGTMDVELTTVHAVKGQTHSATLYLETSYYSKHESERLARQFIGKVFSDKGIQAKESTKMAYVAMSRPTEVLGVAILRERYDALFAGINEDDWNIRDV